MKKTVCVFCASRTDVNPIFMEVARKVGRILSENNYQLLYGGGSVGLMGAAALSAREHGGYVIGIIPEILTGRERLNESADEVVITKDLFERKDLMIERSDAFVVLPGGFGTLDELLEVMTLKQLDMHQKPIYILNTLNYFDPILAFFKTVHEEGFSPDGSQYFEVFDEPQAMIEALQRSTIST